MDARRELGNDWDTLRAEIEDWTPPKGEPRYLVAKAGLLRDETGLLNAPPDYDAAGLSVRDLATWPLIVHMREHSRRVAALVDRTSARPASRGSPSPRRPKRR